MMKYDIVLIISFIVPKILFCYGNDSPRFPKAKFRNNKSILEDVMDSFQGFLGLNFAKEDDLLIDFVTSIDLENDRFFWTDVIPGFKNAFDIKKGKKLKIGEKIIKKNPKLYHLKLRNNLSLPGHKVALKTELKDPSSFILYTSPNPRKIVKKDGSALHHNKSTKDKQKDVRNLKKYELNKVEFWKFFDVVWTSGLILLLLCGVIFASGIKRRKKKVTLYTYCKLGCPEKPKKEGSDVYPESLHCKTDLIQPLCVLSIEGANDTRQKASDSTGGPPPSTKIAASKTNPVPLSVFI